MLDGGGSIFDYAPIIGEGLGIVGSIVNANNQREMNDQNWIRQAQMYDVQRKDALADRDYQNAYNSPAQQMARLKAAGLNPNLIYGSGTQAAGTSQQPRGSSPGGPAGVAPRIDLGGMGTAMMQMYQMGMIQAQQKLIDTKVITEQNRARLLEYQGRGAQASALLSEAKIPFAGALAQAGSDLATAQAYKINAEGNLKALEYEIQNKIYQQGIPLTKAINDTLIQQNIMKLQESQRNLLDQKLKTEEGQTKVKAFEGRLADQGINPHDPAWMKALIIFLHDEFGIKVPGISYSK